MHDRRDGVMRIAFASDPMQPELGDGASRRADSKERQRDVVAGDQIGTAQGRVDRQRTATESQQSNASLTSADVRRPTATGNVL